LILDK